MQKLEACPICSGKQFAPYLTATDYTASGETFHVEQCTSCNLLLTNPRPEPQSAPKYYSAEAYVSHNRRATGIINRIYLIIRRFTLRTKYRTVRSFQTGKSFLDYGCGTGEFLKYARQQGNTTTGIEPSAEARQAIDKGLMVYAHEREVNGKFDVITLFHVLEHLYELDHTVTFLKERLQETGTIFIAVPNHESFDAQLYRNYWAAYDVPRHLWHFSRSNIQSLLDHHQLKVRQVLPMKLDAYYISLLSEKYKAGGRLSIFAFFRALWNGLRSNIRARNNGKYSSLLYVVTHA